VPASPPPPTLLLDAIDETFAEHLIALLGRESHRAAAEARTLVGFQGERGAYGEVAARRLVAEPTCMPCHDFSEVILGVEEGSFDLGAVPIENSLEGSVNQVNELLLDTGVSIVGEAVIPIQHSLLAPPGTEVETLRTVYSHPMALGQCREHLQKHKLEPAPFYNTAGAAKMVARDRPLGAAAIASSLAAELYGLEVLATGIADRKHNATRFLLLSRTPRAEGGNKCSVVLTTEHRSGRLNDVLRAFSEAAINLTRLTSLPARSNPDVTNFLLDFEGARGDQSVRAALDAAAAAAVSLKVLGWYDADATSASSSPNAG
jgi:prephenate dehydratase